MRDGIEKKEEKGGVHEAIYFLLAPFQPPSFHPSGNHGLEHETSSIHRDMYSKLKLSKYTRDDLTRAILSSVIKASLQPDQNYPEVL